MSNTNEKYIGLGLAVFSSLLIGVSFIITKLGLMDATKGNREAAGKSYNYLKNAKWWAGMITMIGGEAANFAAYSFAPAILVTPLGALSVLISAVLASIFLKEKLRKEGIMGCALCLIGSIIVVLHSPEERQITSVDEILSYAMQPAFVVYALTICILSVFLIVRVVPVHGQRNILVYISICSLLGSISVMAAKAFGIALKLTFEGKNQLTKPSTYFFAFVVVTAAVTQMNYFNKALDVFSTNLVTPIYYVFFTSATILASVVLFQGFNDSSPIQTISSFCGFVVIFIGVFLLNLAPTTLPVSIKSKDRYLPLSEKIGDIQMTAFQYTTSNPMSHSDDQFHTVQVMEESDRMEQKSTASEDVEEEKIGLRR